MVCVCVFVCVSGKFYEDRSIIASIYRTSNHLWTRTFSRCCGTSTGWTRCRPRLSLATVSLWRAKYLTWVRSLHACNAQQQCFLSRHVLNPYVLGVPCTDSCMSCQHYLVRSGTVRGNKEHTKLLFRAVHLVLSKQVDRWDAMEFRICVVR